MYSLLLAVIYVAFISLGLPDAIFGSAWPLMYPQFGMPVGAAGLVTMLIAGGTIVSSLYSEKLIRRFGTAGVTIGCVALTAAALLGFSFAGSFWVLCVLAVPYGLGAGSIDAALNNFVALHYKANHMSFLHCFWGLGATLGPSIMGLCLTRGMGWDGGYRVIGLLQTALVICLLASIPLWRKVQGSSAENTAASESLSLRRAIALPGAKAILLAFFCYCALEATAGIWASSFLVLHKGINSQTAASWAALFYLGITLGRFLCGLVMEKFGTKCMIRLGQGIMLLGTLLLLLPLGNLGCIIGLVSVGLGCAPVFPALLHETPNNFGAENSQALMGLQMASAYCGATFMPPLFGLLGEYLSMGLFGIYLLGFAIIMFVMTERMNTLRAKR